MARTRRFLDNLRLPGARDSPCVALSGVLALRLISRAARRFVHSASPTFADTSQHVEGHQCATPCRPVATLLENEGVPEGVSADIIGHEKVQVYSGRDGSGPDDGMALLVSLICCSIPF
jgi:hypothetical protein